MLNIAKTTKYMMVLGLTLQTVHTALVILAHCFPKPVLKLAGASEELISKAFVVSHPMLYAVPLIHLGLIFVLFLLMKKECEQPTSASGVLFVASLLMPTIIFLTSFLTQSAINTVISKHLGVEALAAYSMLRSTIAYFNVITGPVVPLFAAAAGMNWFRWKQSVQ